MCWWCGTCRPNGEVRDGDFSGKLIVDFDRNWRKRSVIVPVPVVKDAVRFIYQSELHAADYLFQPTPEPVDFEYF